MLVKTDRFYSAVENGGMSSDGGDLYLKFVVQADSDPILSVPDFLS
jgi:hypothetical protein